MKQFKLCLVTCACLLVAALGRADTQLVWERTSSFDFTHTAVDASNNVYCLGTNATHDDLILVKISSSGVNQWTHSVTTNPPVTGGYRTAALAVDSTGISYYLHETTVAANRYRAYLTKVNANGSFGWTKELEGPTGSWLSLFPGKMMLDAAQKPCVAYYRWGTTGGQWRFRRYRADGTIEHAGVTGALLTGGVVDDMVMTAEGRPIWRFGKRAEDGLPHNSTIQAYPFFSYPVNMPHAFRIAYTTRLGGFLYGVGLSDASHVILYRMSLASGVMMTRSYDIDTLDNTGTGTTSMAIEQAVADAKGNLHIHGRIKPVAYAERGHRWIVKFDDLSVVSNSQFIGGYPVRFAADRFGSILNVFNAWPPNNSIGVGSHDMNTLLDHNGGYTSVPTSDYRGRDIAVNAKGFGAMVGLKTNPLVSAGVGVVWFIRQLGIRNMTVPMTEYTGGQTITATLNRYYAAAAAETLAFASDTPFASVPSTVTIPGGSATTTVSVLLNPSAVDRFVNLTATDTSERQARKVQFILKAPRPSNLVLTPDGVTGGSPSTGTVTLNGPAPSGGIRVRLSTTAASFIILPVEVVVPAGQVAADFPISTSEVTTESAGSISATYIGVTRYATLTVSP